MSEPSAEPGRRRRKPFGWRKQDGIRLAVLLWLVACWFLGGARPTGDLDPFLEQAWPDAIRMEQIGEEIWQGVDEGGQVLGYATAGTASGYGGPLRVAVAVDAAGTVESVAVLEHRETPSFFRRVTGARFLHQLTGKKHDDPIVLGEDVDGVSGATYTSLALTQSAHRAARRRSCSSCSSPSVSPSGG